MSYEGRHEFLCKNGHRWMEPELYGCRDNGPCPFCKAEIVFDNPIDDTNWDGDGMIPEEEWKKLLVSEAVFEKCNLGHSHCIKEAVYRTPTQEEASKMRHFYNWKTKKMEPYNRLEVEETNGNGSHCNG